jgi:hypothetical protein
MALCLLSPCMTAETSCVRAFLLHVANGVHQMSSVKKHSKDSVQDLLNVIQEEMDDCEFSENRKRVAMQRGGLKRMLASVVDENRSLDSRAAAFDSVMNGLHFIAMMPEEEIENIIGMWDSEEMN